MRDWADFLEDMNMAEVTYIHTHPRVPPEQRQHAMANAAQAAQLVEQNRADMRADLRRALISQRRNCMERVAQIDAALAELDG